MSTTPWMKFYPQDWRADEKLRMCSLSARGLWIEMLSIMHRSERYGHLLIGGHIPTDSQLAVQVGALPDEVSDMIAQLESAGVFSRHSSGSIYSRRMVRDNKKAETARKNGKRGGNPTLSKETEKTPSDNQKDKLLDKGGDNTQKPEARSQIEANASSARDDFQELVQRCCHAAGLTVPDPLRDWNKHNALIGLVQGWIEAGADPDMIHKTVTDRAAATQTRVTSLRWFDGAVRDAVNAKAAAQSTMDQHTSWLVDDILKRQKREAAG